ncbi:hypothetical protein GW17_00002726, partial [Ensete ventricosum]
GLRLLRSHSGHPALVAPQVRNLGYPLLVLPSYGLDLYFGGFWLVGLSCARGSFPMTNAITLLRWLESLDLSSFLAKDKLEKSMVADNESGKSMMSEVRTSSGMFLEKRQVMIPRFWPF